MIENDVRKTRKYIENGYVGIKCTDKDEFQFWEEAIHYSIWIDEDKSFERQSLEDARSVLHYEDPVLLSKSGASIYYLHETIPNGVYTEGPLYKFATPYEF